MASRLGGLFSPAAPSVSHIRLVLLGDSAVGKTCVVSRFTKNEFYDYQESTIGAAFTNQTLQLADHIVKMEMWDTAGQERFRSLAPVYYRGAAAAVVVYDICSLDSFEGAKGWIKELRTLGSPNAVIALAGNKLDLDDKRKVPYTVAKEFAEQESLIFREVSAKTGYNVQELFQEIATKLPKTSAVLPSRSTFVVHRQEPASSCCFGSTSKNTSYSFATPTTMHYTSQTGSFSSSSVRR
eukprot:GILJ01011789.1.p1 GENE.GILJ01011789.1~~GILJ01011789.1.p1  ORF type:complete len:239 (-),score=26.36 GILJ01011789.1:501-1217(-)